MDGNTALLEEIPRIVLRTLDSCFAMLCSQSASKNKHTGLRRFYNVALHGWLYFKGIFKRRLFLRKHTYVLLQNKLYCASVSAWWAPALLVFFCRKDDWHSFSFSWDPKVRLEEAKACFDAAQHLEKDVRDWKNSRFSWVYEESSISLEFLDSLSPFKLTPVSLKRPKLSAGRGCDQCGPFYKKKRQVEGWRTWHWSRQPAPASSLLSLKGRHPTHSLRGACGYLASTCLT